MFTELFLLAVFTTAPTTAPTTVPSYELTKQEVIIHQEMALKNSDRYDVEGENSLTFNAK